MLRNGRATHKSLSDTLLINKQTHTINKQNSTNMKILVALTALNLIIHLISLPSQIENTNDVWKTILCLAIAILSYFAYSVYESKGGRSKRILRF